MKNAAISLVEKLRKPGFQAYFAGGVVRDILMGVKPKDYDIVTSATPDEVEKILPKTVAVGKEFGVIIAIEGQYKFEIATFRSEGKYSDLRRPDKVFWSDAEHDALRRDFTINGMFYSPVSHRVIDYVGGKDDIKNKVIRFIGNPDERIKEDHLRILRAVRFKNTLNFNYDKRTYEAIKNNAHRIQSVSAERIREELNKMFSSSNRAKALRDLEETGLLKYILPEVNRLKGLPEPKEFHHEGDTFTHTCLALESLPESAPLYLVWATLLHDSGKYFAITFPKQKDDRIRFNKHVKYSAGIASAICRRLKFPNYERKIIVWLVKNHMMMADIPKMALAKQRRWLMNPWFPMLLELSKADSLGIRPVRLNLYKKDLALYNQTKKLLDQENKKAKFKPLLSGKDLIYEFKLDSGPKIGEILKTLEDAQLEGKIKTKEQALKLARKTI